MNNPYASKDKVREFFEKPQQPIGEPVVRDGRSGLDINMPAWLEGWTQPPDMRDMPGYERLTPGEQWFLEDGVGYVSDASNFAKGLGDFVSSIPVVGTPLAQGGSWALGKAVQLFDWGYKQAERTIGLAQQVAYAAVSPDASQGNTLDDIWNNFGAAWEAGSLWAETAIFPKIGEDGMLYIPNDLPGGAGLVAARRAIADGNSVEKVREAYLNSLGIMRVRAELQDVYANMGVDPVSWLMGKVGVVAKAEALKIAGRITSVMPEAQAARILELEGMIADLEKIGDLKKLAAAQEELAATRAFTQMTAAEQKFMKLLGLYDWDKPVSELSNWEKIARRFNPFALTSQARATEYLERMLTSTEYRLLSGVDNMSDAEGLVKRWLAAADGLRAPEMQQFMLTIEGRVMDSMIKKTALGMKQMFEGFVELEAKGEGPMIRLVQSVLGEKDAGKIAQYVEQGQLPAMISRVLNNATEQQRLQLAVALKRMGVSDLTPDVFAKAWKVSKEIPTSVNEFKALTYNMVADYAHRTGTMIYGVKYRGFWQELGDTFKKAETLAYLRLSPSYPIKNYFNNVLTMVRDGGLGILGTKAPWTAEGQLEIVENFKNTYGVSVPARGFTGIGPAEVSENIAKLSQSPLSQAYAVGSGKIANDIVGSGILNKVSRYIDNAGDVLGKADMGELAQTIERASSLRAVTHHFPDGMKKFFGVGVRGSVPHMREMNGFAALGFDADFVKTLENAVTGAVSHDKLDALLGGADNLRLTSRNIIEAASARSGTDITGILGLEETEKMANAISDALKAGRPAEPVVRDFLSSWEKHITQWSDGALEEMLDEDLAKLGAQGPAYYSQFLTGLADDIHATRTRHSMQISQMAEIKNAGLSSEARNIRVSRLLEGEEAFYDRFWNRWSKRADAIVNAGKRGGLSPQTVKELRSSFREISSSWQKFFKGRNADYRSFFSKKDAGGWEEMIAKYDGLYDAIGQRELELLDLMDDHIASMLGPQADIYKASRQAYRELQRGDMAAEMAFRQQVRMAGDEVARQSMWKIRWQERQATWVQQQYIQRAGVAAMAGNPDAAKLFEADLSRLSAAQAANALAEGAVEAGVKLPNTASGVSMPDLRMLIKDEMYNPVAFDELMYNLGHSAIDNMVAAAEDIAGQVPVSLGNLSEAQVNFLRSYIAGAHEHLRRGHHAAAVYSVVMRDASLLNYSRRINLDAWATTVFPYSFWMMHSAFNWALWSVNRPQMAAFILRVDKLLRNGVYDNDGFPSRLRGNIKIPMPFVPEWLGGGVYVNPMNLFLPLDNVRYPFEEVGRRENQAEFAATNKLQEMLENGAITEDEFNQALQYRSGGAWEQAVYAAEQDDANGRMNPLDVLFSLTSPHTPYQWAYLQAQGRGDEIGTLFPLTRGIKGLTQLFTGAYPELAKNMGMRPGVGLNPEGAIRQAVGMYPFSKWEDYYSERMLANLATENKFSLEEIKLAMVEHRGMAWDEAVRRAGIEMGANRFFGSLGVPVKFYPEGEKELRALQSQFSAAIEAENKGNEGAINRFFEAHPEYEARLALFKSPEERLNQFLVDSLWDTWNNLKSVDRRAAIDALGMTFEQGFVNKDTRVANDLPPETLALWLKALGGSPPGGLGKGAIPVDFAPPEVAEQAQYFYDYRKRIYPGYFELQNNYYDLREGSARSSYLRLHPELREYWNWRNDFLKRNPAVIDYIDDDYSPNYSSPAELEAAQRNQPQFSEGELRERIRAMGGNALLRQYDRWRQTGQASPDVVAILQNLAAELGITVPMLTGVP